VVADMAAVAAARKSKSSRSSRSRLRLAATVVAAMEVRLEDMVVHLVAVGHRVVLPAVAGPLEVEVVLML